MMRYIGGEYKGLIVGDLVDNDFHTGIADVINDNYIIRTMCIDGYDGIPDKMPEGCEDNIALAICPAENDGHVVYAEIRNGRNQEEAIMDLKAKFFKGELELNLEDEIEIE